MVAVNHEFAIEAVDLRKTYREGLIKRRLFQALNGVSFQVPAGCVFGLLGPNGAGKTTFVKILMGIIRRTAGDAKVFGVPAGSRQARRWIGYLPERLALPTYLTGFQALEYCGGLSGMSGGEVRGRREELLSTVGLDGWGKTPISKYSKGMVQRLGLAQAMLHRPKLLVLDEPTDGLDPKARAGVREILVRLASQGSTVFLNSHLLQEVEVLCQQVAILSEGNVKYCGSVDKIQGFIEGSRGRGSELQVRLVIKGSEAAIQALQRQRSAADAQTQTGWNPEWWWADQIKSLGADQWQLEERLPGQAELDQRIDKLRAAGISLCALEPKRVTLEAAFLELVGHSEAASEVKEADGSQRLLQAGRRS